MRSMTGFGRASGEGERFRITLILRSVNHRFLDLVLRLRDEQRDAEPALRELFSGQLERGRVEMSCEIEAVGQRRIEPQVDEDLIRALGDLSADLERREVVSGGLGMGDLLRLPDAVRLEREAVEWREDDRALLLRVAADALAQMVEARSLEGAKLADALTKRIDGLEALREDMVQLAAALPAQMAASLEQRIQQLLDGVLPDESRIAQEVALLVDRGDVSEELDRLGSHLEHFREVAASAGSIGKRLDFLGQEIFRELNTIGSKCRDSELVQRVLDGKVLCEQVREQVQNVE
ncbi:MAG: YicC/YloC family endoribonuclease [Acidobacteriota bacterium]